MDFRDEEPVADDAPVELSPEDSALWLSLVPYLSLSDQSMLCLSEETVEAIERACPPIDLDRYVVEDMDAVFQRACNDVDFSAAVENGQLKQSVGAYIRFLRERAGLSIDEAACEADFEFQTLVDLERDAIAARKVPPRPLASLVDHCKGTLDGLLSLLTTLVREPRFVSSNHRGSLYRGAPGSTRLVSEEASLAARREIGDQYENPKYSEEVSSVERLAWELRIAWREL